MRQLLKLAFEPGGMPDTVDSGSSVSQPITVFNPSCGTVKNVQIRLDMDGVICAAVYIDRILPGEQVEKNRADADKHVIRFYDIEGSPLAVIEYGEGAEPIQLDYNRFIGDYLFGLLSTTGLGIVTEPTWYLDLNDIGTDNLIWRRWEP